MKCDPNSVCLSDEGGYTCSCKLGYAGNGQSCEGKVDVKMTIIKTWQSVCSSSCRLAMQYGPGLDLAFRVVILAPQFCSGKFFLLSKSKIYPF